MPFVMLGLGSNAFFNESGPVELLAYACRELRKILEKPLFSSVYESRAMYYENQQNFFNMAAAGYVCDDFSPYDMLSKIHGIEAEFGRDRDKEVRFGPRPLDIDIEEFGDVVMNEESLVLPHPRLKERQFVLIPLLEILNECADCNKKELFFSLLKKLPDQGVKKCNDGLQYKFRKLSGI